MKKFRKTKYMNKNSLLIFLAISSIVAVGFSSWTSINYLSDSRTLNLNSGSIEYLDKCFYFNGEAELTKFSSNGFLDGSSNVGILKIPFQINTQEKMIKDYFPNDLVKFKVLIRSENTTINNFFSLFTLNNCGLKYSSSDDSYSSGNFEYSLSPFESAKQNENDWLLNFEINNFPYSDSSYAVFLLETEFIFASDKNFANDFFNKLDNNQDIKLNITVGAID